MNSYKKFNSINLVSLVLAIVLALMSFVIRPVCTKLMADGGHMPCHYTGILLTVLGGGSALLLLVAFFVRKRACNMIVDFVVLLSMLAAYLIPARIIKVFYAPGKAIGLCKMETMSCHGSFATSSIIILVLGLLVLFHFIWGALFLKSAKKSVPEQR